MNKKIVVSGMRPTGFLHLGNYFGALKDFIKLQETHQCFFFIADWHALTTMKDYDQLRKHSLEIALSFLSVGLDPDKCTIFLQSDIPEIAELALLLSMFQPANELSTLPTYVEVIKKHPDCNNAGLLTYPILMTADILTHKATLIPVGSDQEIHVRVARNIARRFNNKFGPIFPMPKTFEKESVKVPGLDGTDKMGKSEGNTINLTDRPEVVAEKISKAVTDTARKQRNDPGNPFVCNLYAMHELVSSKETTKTIQTNCQTAQIGCVGCKRLLSGNIVNLLRPMQEKRKEIIADPNLKLVKDVLEKGETEARKSAHSTLMQVREKMGITGKEVPL